MVKHNADVRCDISDLPVYSCYDCLHHLHGKHVDLDAEMLRRTVGPSSYTDIHRLSPQPEVRVVEANYDGACDHPDCNSGKFKATDKIAMSEEYGWVHARHVL